MLVNMKSTTNSMSEKWIRDTGIVLSLFFLVLSYNGHVAYLFISFTLLLFVLIAPKALYPIAYIWLKCTDALSFIVPKIFFGLVFCTIIVPVAFVRRCIGMDSFRFPSSSSAFFDRNHMYTKGDVEAPY